MKELNGSQMKLSSTCSKFTIKTPELLNLNRIHLLPIVSTVDFKQVSASCVCTFAINPLNASVALIQKPVIYKNENVIYKTKS